VELELMTDGIILVIRVRVRVRSITSSATHNVSFQLVPSRVGPKHLLSRTNSTAATKKRACRTCFCRRVSLGCARAPTRTCVCICRGEGCGKKHTPLVAAGIHTHTSLPFFVKTWENAVWRRLTGNQESPVITANSVVLCTSMCQRVPVVGRRRHLL
jgi:hypothetical protein